MPIDAKPRAASASPNCDHRVALPAEAVLLDDDRPAARGGVPLGMTTVNGTGLRRSTTGIASRRA
jgi:hypothetical protein